LILQDLLLCLIRVDGRATCRAKSFLAFGFVEITQLGVAHIVKDVVFVATQLNDRILKFVFEGTNRAKSQSRGVYEIKEVVLKRSPLPLKAHPPNKRLASAQIHDLRRSNAPCSPNRVDSLAYYTKIRLELNFLASNSVMFKIVRFLKSKFDVTLGNDRIL
jgi:hypothetical protein